MSGGGQQGFGLVGMQSYFPRNYVSQQDLEKHLGVSSGKFVKGLGQTDMAFVTDREDVISICMTVLQRLIDVYGLDPAEIGRLEVGTETILDHSKSIKTYLMQIMGEDSDVEGIDVINACYGGTAALFNSLAWGQSEEWDGRYAVVISADIAEYKPGPARPTGGAGAIAMLLGPDAPITFTSRVRSTHMEHAYDFYKPNLSSPFPVVFGHLSNECYLRSVDVCYERFLNKFQAKFGKKPRLSDFDYVAFHAPYNKLVRKSYARLLYNDALRFPEEFKSVEEYLKAPKEETYNSSKLLKAFVKLSSQDYESRVAPTTTLPRLVGNSYTASLYLGLLSLVHNAGENLSGKKIMMFSYGSGLASTLFLLEAGSSASSRQKLREMKELIGLDRQIAARIRKSPTEFDYWTERRCVLGERFGDEFRPNASVTDLSTDAYYLDRIDESGRRFYSSLKIFSRL